MNRLFYAVEKIAYWGGYLSGWLVPGMMVLVALEVFTRYVLSRPLLLADEFSAYMLVALSFLGLAYTWRQRGHVRITILVSRLSKKRAGWIRLGALIAVFLFVLEMDRSAYKMVVYALQMNMKSSTFLMVPLFWPQMPIFIGFVLLTLLILADILRAARKIRANEDVEDFEQ
jgi:TRAP-type C4-dicarboxylate transport system permease small subunit